MSEADLVLIVVDQTGCVACSYGKVYKAKDVNTGRLVALKKTRLEAGFVSSTRA